MADDLSWIDHPANLRANAVLLRAVADQSLLHADEIERLTAECEAWRECAQYDPKMTGPAFKGWDRSALDRCRTRYIEMKP